MIGVKLEGRFGNQMFQYAFIYARAIELGTDFFALPFRKGNFAESYLELKTDSDRRLLKPPIRSCPWLRTLFFRTLSQNEGERPEEVINKNRQNAIWYGFFQSEAYFLPIKDRLSNFFAFKKEYTDNFKKVHAQYSSGSPIIAVHIRRTDYVRFGNETLGGKDLRLPAVYYQECIKRAFHEYPDARVVFMSDDMTWVKENIPAQGNYVYSCSDMATDFQTLQHADALVLSPSSFSWWAAYLNNKPAKMVFAPRHWLGFKVGREYPVGITPQGWKLIDIGTDYI